MNLFHISYKYFNDHLLFFCFTETDQLYSTEDILVYWCITLQFLCSNVGTWKSAKNESLLSSLTGRASILEISWIFFTKFDNSTFSWKQDRFLMLGSNTSSKQTAHPGNNQTCTTQCLHNRKVRLLKSNYRDCTKIIFKI